MKVVTFSAIAAAFAVAGEALPSVLQIDLASIQNGAIVTSDMGFKRLDDWTYNQSDKDSITMVGVLPEQWAAAPPRPTRSKSSDHLPAWLQAATLHRKADSFVAMRDESDENMIIYVVPPFFTQENRLVLADNGQAIDMERMAFAYLYTICSKIVTQSHGALSALYIDELSRIATSAKVLAETVPASSGGFVQPELLMLISNTDGTDEAVSVALPPLDIAEAGNSHLRLVEASRESALGAPESPLGSLDRSVRGMAVASTGSGRFSGGSWQGIETGSSALVQSGSIAALRTPRASAACGAFSAVTIAALGSTGKPEEQANLVNRFVNTLPSVGAVTRSAGARAIGGLQPPVAIAGLKGNSSVLAISDEDGLDEASGDQVVRYDGRYSIPQLQEQAKSAERAITAMDNQYLFQAGRERLLQFREKYGEKVRRDVVDLASHAYQEDALTDGNNQPIRKTELDKLIVGAREDAKEQLHAGLGSRSSVVEDDMLKDLGLKEQAARTALDYLREQYRKELEAAVDGVVTAQIAKAKNKDVPVEATAVDEIDRETLSLASGKVSADAYAWLVEERGESSSSAMLAQWPRIKVAGQTLKRRSDDARAAASKRVVSRAKKDLKNSKLAGQSSGGSGGVAIMSSNQIKEITTAVLQTTRESVETDCRAIAGGCAPNTLQQVEDAARQMSSELRRNVEKAVREEVRQRFLVAQTTAQQQLPRVVEQSFNELLSGDAVKDGLAASLNEARGKAETAQRLYVEGLGFASAPVEDASRAWAGTQEETIRSHVKQYETMLEDAFREADIQIATSCEAVGAGDLIPDLWTIEQVIDYTRSLLRENNVIAAKFIESGALETRIRTKIVEVRPGVIAMRNSGLFWIVLVASLAALVGVVALGMLAGGESKRFGVLAGPTLALIVWAPGGSSLPVLAPVVFSGGAAVAGVAAVVLANRNAASYTAAATGVILLGFGAALHLMGTFAHYD